MRKKSSYRPKIVMPNALQYVLSGVKPPTSDELFTLQASTHSSLYSLTHGTGSKDDWDTLSDAIKTSYVLCKNGVGEDCKTDVLNALSAHNNCGIRHISGNNFGYTGVELESVKVALAVYDSQLKLVTSRELIKAKAQKDKL